MYYSHVPTIRDSSSHDPCTTVMYPLLEIVAHMIHVLQSHMYPLLEIVAHMIMAVAIVCCVASGVKVQWKGDISLRLYPTSVEKLKPL